MVAMTVAYWVFSAPLVRIFLDNSEVVAYGSIFLRGACLAIPFLAIDFTFVFVFQSVGMGHTSLILAITRKIILEIPLLFLRNWLFPLYGLPYAQVLAEVVLAAVGFLMLRRVFRQNTENQTLSRD